jgi:hypothetical protein
MRVDTDFDTTKDKKLLRRGAFDQKRGGRSPVDIPRKSSQKIIRGRRGK